MYCASIQCIIVSLHVSVPTVILTKSNINVYMEGDERLVLERVEQEIVRLRRYIYIARLKTRKV